jgi:7-cyano-7-deazaguanine synthase in queuosine biosynthesis
LAKKIEKPVAKTSRRDHTLVMLSGGIDSTAALWMILNNPEGYGQIHVHHIHIQNVEARWKAEASAVKSVLAYMKKHSSTPFTSSESTINTPAFGNKFLFDTEVVSFISGYMTSRDPLITKVIIGVTASDYEAGISAAVERGKAIHNAFHPGKNDPSGAVKEYPIAMLTKEEAYKTLPADLAVLTWSCRTPHYADGKPIECGKCKTCLLELRAIKRPLSSATRTFR